LRRRLRSRFFLPTKAFPICSALGTVEQNPSGVGLIAAVTKRNDTKMKVLEFVVEHDEETGAFTASWDDPKGGGITTQAATFEELLSSLTEAVNCHFVNRPAPKRARVSFRFDRELELQPA
jgi:predicted RNase H-like HicB family nuclease